MHWKAENTLLHPADGMVVARLYAAAITLYAFWLYNQKTGKISVGTWFVLLTGDTLDVISYWFMTVEWEKVIIPVTFAGASVLTFGHALIRKRFSWPDRVDVVVIGLDSLITIGWFYFQNTTPSADLHSTATLANLLYQATAFLAFVPMYYGLVKNRDEESLGPWALWSFAHLIFFITAALEHNDWEEMAYPLMGLITHWLVFLFELNRRSKQKLTRPPP